MDDDNKTKIGKSTAIVVSITILMKAVAFVKQTVLARYFGATIEMDLYLLSVDTVGDFSNAFFSALSVSVMTLYTGYSVRGEIKKASELMSATFQLFIPLALIFTALFFSCSGMIAEILAMNYSGEEQRIVAGYIRVVSPTILFSCITYICVALLDAKRIFGPGKLINFTLGIVVIIVSVSGNRRGVNILAWAYMSAYFIHMIFVCLCCRKYVRNTGFVDKCRILSSERPVLTMLLPILIGNAAAEINTLIDKLLATGMGDGGVAAQTYGGTLNSFVVTIFVASPAGVLVSYLSHYAAKQDLPAVREQIGKNICFSVMVLLPVSVITYLEAERIVKFVYQRGMFSQNAVVNTAGILRGYAAGFCFVAIREIMIKVHLAYRDSRMLMLNGLVTTGINICSSVILSDYLGLMGLSLGTSVGAFFGMALAILTVKRYLKLKLSDELKSEPGKMLIAVIPVILILEIDRRYIAGPGSAAYFVLLLSGCMLVYVFALYVLRSSTLAKSVEALKKAVHKKISI